MNKHIKHAKASGNMLIIGFGSIGQGVLPLILRHIDIAPESITIVTADDRGEAIAREYGVRFLVTPLHIDNFESLLSPLLSEGSFLVNVSVNVSSLALVKLCQRQSALYIDTCIEPWPGGYTDKSVPASQRSNYAFRHQLLALRAQYADGPTAVICQGANPGMVSHFVKQALLNLQTDILGEQAVPKSRAQWASLAKRLNINTIHIAERDNQISSDPKRVGEFVNTWSCDGFVSEGCQPAELSWGTHEKHFPQDGLSHDFGNGCGIIIKRPGAAVKGRSWVPEEGPFQGWIIGHNETISIADYLTVWEGDQVLYRPSCHYVYHPCDNAVLSLHELNGRGFCMQERQRIMGDDIVDGMDELGVLLCGHARNAYWYGSQLSIQDARRLVPYNSATSLQVTSAVLAGIVWALENPMAGIVESDDMDFARNLDVQGPYIAPVKGCYTDWTPLNGRETLFDEALDETDPWQFLNVRVF
jgi:homospermidine synthase